MGGSAFVEEPSAALSFVAAAESFKEFVEALALNRMLLRLSGLSVAAGIVLAFAVEELGWGGGLSEEVPGSAKPSGSAPGGIRPDATAAASIDENREPPRDERIPERRGRR